METLQLCTFYVDGLHLGIEAQRIREVTRARELTPIPLSPHAIAGLMNLRSQIVPAVELRRCLAMTDRPPEADAMNVITRTREGLMALLVDGVGDVLELSADTFEPPPSNLSERARRLIRGAYKLDAGLLLSLDIEALVDPASWRAVTPENALEPREMM